MCCQKKDLDMVKWLYKNTENKCTYKSLKYATENGDLNMIEWLKSNEILKKEKDGGCFCGKCFCDSDSDSDS